MKTTKKLLVLLLALCCIGSTIIPSYATEARPMAETTYEATALLSISSSGQALCAVMYGTATLRRGRPFQWEANMMQKSIPKVGPQGTPKPLDASSAYCVEGRTFMVQPVFQGAGERSLASMRSTASQRWKILHFPLDKPYPRSYTSCYGEY